MRKKIIRFLVGIAVIFCSFISFEKTVNATEVYDTNKQTISFSLVDGEVIQKDIQNDSSNLSSSVKGIFPNTGEIKHPLFLIGVLIVIIVGCLFLFKNKQRKEI